jgi:hypothetical protein
LDVQVLAARADDLTALTSASSTSTWRATILARLRFQPRYSAQYVPARAELEAEALPAACPLEDLACLEEAAENDRELSPLLGEFE